VPGKERHAPTTDFFKCSASAEFFFEKGCIEGHK
jgi:hypothetical protein